MPQKSTHHKASKNTKTSIQKTIGETKQKADLLENWEQPEVLKDYQFNSYKDALAKSDLPPAELAEIIEIVSQDADKPVSRLELHEQEKLELLNVQQNGVSYTVDAIIDEMESDEVEDEKTAFNRKVYESIFGEHPDIGSEIQRKYFFDWWFWGLTLSEIAERYGKKSTSTIHQAIVGENGSGGLINHAKKRYGKECERLYDIPVM